MYAIVEIAGQQFKVAKDQKVFVHRLNEERGAQVEFDKVLLVDADGKITIGAPVVEGAKVVAEVVSHVKGDKVIVFKKKRRKGYRVRNGHRQCFTELVIKEVVADTTKKVETGTIHLEKTDKFKNSQRFIAAGWRSCNTFLGR